MSQALTVTAPAVRGERADVVAEFVALGVAMAAIPVFFHESQLLAGTLVNAALVLGALRLTCPYRRATLVMVPALAALAAANFLGPFVLGLVALVPAIWAANAVYMRLIARGSSFAMALPAAAFAKTALLLMATALLAAFKLLPLTFVTVMAPTALLTALLGGLLGYGVHRAWRL